MFKEIEMLLENYSMFHYSITCPHYSFLEKNLFNEIPATYRRLSKEKGELFFRCRVSERPKWELILKTKLSSIYTERIRVGEDVLKVLKMKD